MAGTNDTGATSPAPRSQRVPLLAACAVAGVVVAACAVFSLASADVLSPAVRSAFAVACVAALFALGFIGLFVWKRLPVSEEIQRAVCAWTPGSRHVEVLTITAVDDPVAQWWNELIRSWRDAQRAAIQTEANDKLQQAEGHHGFDGKALDLLPQGVLLVTPNRHVSAANGAACRILMRSKERLANAPVDKVLEDEALNELIAETLSSPQNRGGQTELRLEPEEGVETIVRVTVRGLGEGATRQALVVLEDVTQQRTADQARNLFVAQATHELRTPLTNIGLYVERAIELDEAAVAERSECLNVINGEVLRLARLVDEVLSVSEIEAGSLNIRRDDVRFDDLVKRLEQDYRPQAKAQAVELTFDLPPKLSVVQGDREKVSVAMHNLLSNAVKYTPRGKRVRVEVEETDGFIEARVSDTGIGISGDDLPRIFDKFYRANDKRIAGVTGTGLGLSLAREVIRLHGGDITAESTLNEGSTFTLRLPVKDPAKQTGDKGTTETKAQAKAA